MSAALAWLVTTDGASPLASTFAIARALNQMTYAYPATGPSTNWQWLRAELEQTGGAPNAHVASAVDVETLEQARAELRALADRLGDLLPDKLKPLVQPVAMLAENGAGVEWPLFGLEKEAAKGTWKFGLDAGAECTLTAYKPQDDTALGFPVPPGHLGLGLALHGSASVDLQAAGAFSWGSVKVGAAGQASAVLEAFSRPEPDVLQALALSDLVSAIPAPGRLDALFDKSTTLPIKQVVQALHLKVDGNLTVNGAIKVGTVLVKSGAGNVNMASLGVDLGLSAQFQQDRGYNLRVVLANGKAKVDLTCSKESSKELGLGLDAGLSIQGYANKLSAALQEALPTAQPLIAKLGSLADLQGWLHGEVAEVFDGPFEDALVDLVAAGSPAARKTQLLALTHQALTQVYTDFSAGAKIDFKKIDAKQWQDALLKKVLALTGAAPGSKLDTAVKKHLQPAIVHLTEQLQSQVKQQLSRVSDEVRTALSGSRDEAAKLLGPVVEAGATAYEFIDTLLQDIDANIKQFDARLVAWLNVYEEKRTALLQSIAAIAASQLKLSFGSVISTTHEEVTLLSLTFTGFSYAGEALYRGLWRGDLSGLPELMERALAEHAIQPDYSGWLVDTMVRQKVYRFSLDFFGLGSINATRSALSKVAIKADLRTQRILGCSDSVVLQQKLVNFGKEQEARFGLEMDTYAEAANGVPLSVTFTESGKALDKADVAMYFESMVGARLVQPSVRERAWRLLQASPGQQGNQLNRATLRTQLQLTGEEWLTLLHVQSAEIYEPTCRVVYDIAQMAWERDRPGAPLADWVAMLAENLERPELLTLTGLVKWCAQNRSRLQDDCIKGLGLPSGHLSLIHFVSIFGRLGAISQGFVNGIDVLQGISATLVKVAADPASIGQEQLRIQLDQANKKLIKAWEFSSSTAQPALFTPLRFPWPTLAFYAALALAVGRSRDRLGLINLVSSSGKDEDAVLIV